MWDKGTRVYISLEPHFIGRVCGLCRNFDGNWMTTKLDKVSFVIILKPMITQFYSFLDFKILSFFFLKTFKLLSTSKTWKLSVQKFYFRWTGVKLGRLRSFLARFRLLRPAFRRPSPPVRAKPGQVPPGESLVQGHPRTRFHPVPPLGGPAALLRVLLVGLVRSRRWLRVLLHGAGRLRHGLPRAERWHPVQNRGSVRWVNVYN